MTNVIIQVHRNLFVAEKRIAFLMMRHKDFSRGFRKKIMSGKMLDCDLESHWTE